VINVNFVALESTTMMWVVKTAKTVSRASSVTAVRRMLNFVLNALLVNTKVTKEERLAFDALLVNTKVIQEERLAFNAQRDITVKIKRKCVMHVFLA
jgi:hypothetical protein